jgi:hypothetical protein
MSEWQPIETAPKTTHSILAWCPERQNTYVICWLQGLDEPGCWAHFGGGHMLDEAPTHWMPLPEPPK